MSSQKKLVLASAVNHPWCIRTKKKKVEESQTDGCKLKKGPFNGVKKKERKGERIKRNQKGGEVGEKKVMEWDKWGLYLWL